MVDEQSRQKSVLHCLQRTLLVLMVWHGEGSSGYPEDPFFYA
jgi:hypothetical protein